MVTLLFYYQSHPHYNWDTKKRTVPFCIPASAGTLGASLTAPWEYLPKSTSFRKKVYSPMGFPEVSQVFSPMQCWLSKIQTVSGSEKGDLLHQVLLNGRTQASVPKSLQQNNTHYNSGVMLHASKWLPKILLSFHMAASESRNKDSISTMN